MIWVFILNRRHAILLTPLGIIKVLRQPTIISNTSRCGLCSDHHSTKGIEHSGILCIRRCKLLHECLCLPFIRGSFALFPPKVLDVPNFIACSNNKNCAMSCVTHCHDKKTCLFNATITTALAC